MIVAGKSRQNGKQLGRYLLAQGENENIHVLEIRGSASKSVEYGVLEMSLAAEMNKRGGKLGLYHAQIAPAYGEDNLTEEQWLRAADVLEEELKLTGQKRVIVLHDKKGKLHAHIVWQREKDGKFISDKGSYYAHDRTRDQLEREFGHTRTAQPLSHKEQLTALWQSHQEGRRFVEAAQELGYVIGDGYTTPQGKKRPYSVLTPEGKKLDLVRQLQKVKTASVGKKLKTAGKLIVPEAEIDRLAKEKGYRKERQDWQELAMKASNNLNDIAKPVDKTKARETFQTAIENKADLESGSDQQLIDELRQVLEQREQEQKEREAKWQEMKDNAPENETPAERMLRELRQNLNNRDELGLGR
jgi:hypothetical protein